ncbi:MAG: sugar ABC transporter permease [Spirochaetia bacterium]|nr:sugar ABC transporter permease [Spirochaetia bacterium]MCF7946899.1 sugar ABC transporter permease [Spirochaetia bacterium]
MTTIRKQKIQEVLMVSPALILLIIFLVVPFFVSISLSFTNQRLVQGPVAAKYIAFRNYAQILGDRHFWQAFYNVGRFTLFILPLQCGLALLFASMLNKQQVLKGFLRSMYFLPFITPMVIVTVIWKTMYQYPKGIFNYVLGIISGGMIQPVEWLGTAATAMPAIVILSAWQAYGFQMIIYLGGLKGIPDELYEASNIDGANKIQQFFHITWPGLRETNILILIITTIQALKLFTQVNILTQGGPNGSTNTLVHYIYDAGFVGQKIGYSSAASVLLFVIVVMIFLVQRRVVEGTPVRKTRRKS